MSADFYNVINQQVIDALQEDTVLNGGALDIATWDEELREDASVYNDHELPAIAVSTEQLESENARSDWVRTYYQTLHVVTMLGNGASVQSATKTAKQYAARVEYVWRQQMDATKQVSSVAAELDGAETDSIIVYDIAVETDAVALNGSFRGGAAVVVSWSIDFQPTID